MTQPGPLDHPSPPDGRERSADRERRELVERLDRLQDGFERRALSSLAEPLISTPLTMQQLKVLTLVAIDPERATGANLAGLLHVSLASMSGMVDRLVDHGMLERTEDASDRRVRRLSVTPEGSEMVRGLLSTAGRMPVPAIARLELADLRALVQGITALDRAFAELLTEQPPAAAP